jgi:hypothetical protein
MCLTKLCPFFFQTLELCNVCGFTSRQ